MEARRVIRMTESDLIAANLEALGIAPPVHPDEEVFAVIDRTCREDRRFVRFEEVADHFRDRPRTTVSNAFRRLLDAGRILKVAKGLYIPRVTP